MKPKLKRYNIKKLLADPEIRRWMIIRGTMSLNEMEGIDVPYMTVARLYDEMMEEKQNDS